ncbi:MAG: nucleotidyltransferase family protein [Deferrisomatales bacterium]
MAEVIEAGKAIRLQEHGGLRRRREWRPWKAHGYRVPAPDGVTIWHEREAIRSLVLECFATTDADIFLFGSRGAGKAREGADYDVGFATAAPVPAARLAALQETLEELPIPSHVELVDFGKVEKRFAAMVLERKEAIEVWKTRQKSSLFT